MSTAAQLVTSCSSCLELPWLSDYTLFLRGDYTQGRNVQGKVAAGGNITLTGFSMGSGLPDDDISNALVAGGNLSVSDGAVWGDARYGGSYSGVRVEYRRGAVAQDKPIEFDKAFETLKALSLELAGQPVNGTTWREDWGGIKMSGADPCLNVFEVNASTFVGAQRWDINAPAGSFVVVNIRGTPLNFTKFDLPDNGINPRRVLYNFVDATEIYVENHKILGTVLAPEAHVTFINGAWYGGIYAFSLSGNGEGRIDPLDGGEGECEEGTTSSCTTSCGSTGTRVCSATCAWGECTPPEAEACNGVDDNCNGQVDEGFECTGSSTQSCTAWCGASGTQTCNPATCSYGACAASSCCEDDADCGGGFYCDGSLCVARKGNGASCSGANQCDSEQCVDGVCCDTACAGACDSCVLPGKAGSCLPCVFR